MEKSSYLKSFNNDSVMYAILESDIVISVGFKNGDIITDCITNKVYDTKEKSIYSFIQMTLDNSPAFIGMSYDNNKFYFKEA